MRRSKAFDEETERRFICVGCGHDCHDEYYMIEDALWRATGLPPDGGMLCIGCVETRLGRPLTPADFIDAPINYLPTERSLRLRERLGMTG